MKHKKITAKQMKSVFSRSILLIICMTFSMFTSFSQSSSEIFILNTPKVVHPLDELTVYTKISGTLTVRDSKNRTYFSSKASQHNVFKAGGAAGKQTVTVSDENGKIKATSTFILEAVTEVRDGGKFNELFNILYEGLTSVGKGGYEEVRWNGKNYKYYVPWDLDNNNTMTGIQYFLPYGNEYTDLLRETQRKDGMIWSFVRPGNTDYYFNETAYGPLNFFKKYDDCWFARQPVDNHSDYCYVNMFYKQWKSSGDNEWMKKTIASAALALDYCYTDSIRWSKRFQLLKRPYCIDSWDFQVDDEYTPQVPVSQTIVIVPGKTKYGVFFGDNTGYYEACNQVAEMYDILGDTDRATLYRKRGEAILRKLTELSWNGKFFTHFIDEDPTVKRKLGVDEKTQIAQGNMYSLNRGLPHEMNVAIIKTYLNLKENLPVGSPGEWYSIYPPFQKGFERHNGIWQYMNGGVAGHAIGELARGAYENGYEKYGSDILERLLDLARKHDNKIYFSYTGSIPPAPSAPTFKTIDISHVTNMDIWDQGNKATHAWMNETEKGNDLRGLPVGLQTFNGIEFNVLDPEKNNRRSVIGLSTTKNFPSQVQVSINDTAGSVYLLNSASGVGKGKTAGAMTFIYSDGTSVSKYIFENKDVVGWWFPMLKTNHSGIAWAGPNLFSTHVGVCWTVIDNPNPSKKIEKLQFNASLEGGIYSVLAISLANKPHYVKPDEISFGGPDNWSSGNGMGALIEGLAGLKNETVGYENVTLSPRWTSAGVDTVNVTANLVASNGYVSYKFKNDSNAKTISLLVTGSGKEAKTHVLLPENMKTVKTVTLNDKPLEFTLSKVEGSNYVDFKLPLTQIQSVLIQYQ